ncbi:MAG: hypothetical protein E6767_08940 [Dysgonomonas sp.]|nr:hypothetical protein [Dysgonomonas sp.]
MINIIGFGIIFSVITKLIANMVDRDISTAVEYGGWLIFVYALIQFVFAPVLGNLSDGVGWRPVLLILYINLHYAFIYILPNKKLV